MIRYLGFTCLAASLGLSACDKGSNIEDETRDLAEAQQNTGNVAKELEERLNAAKAEVLELEKKLALAREGITDEVLEERRELQGALDSQRRELQEDINEAHEEAQLLNQNTDKALQQLQQTQPPAHVDTELKTETDVVRADQQPVESPTRDEILPVRGGPESEPVPSTAPTGEVESTTTTTRSVPPSPASPVPPEPAPSEPAPPAPAPSAPAAPSPAAPAPPPPAPSQATPPSPAPLPPAPSDKPSPSDHPTH